MGQTTTWKKTFIELKKSAEQGFKQIFMKSIEIFVS